VVTPVAQQAANPDDEVIRLAEEHLEVGKRKIETGWHESRDSSQRKRSTSR
jgi:hypothetical protein